MKLPLRSAAIKAQCEGIINIPNLVPITVPPICDDVQFGGFMLFEDGGRMEFEDGGFMEYEG